jgi:hypothetical protein
MDFKKLALFKTTHAKRRPRKSAMETRELKATELDELLDLYSHMHNVDDPLPERKTVEEVWQEIHDNSYFKYFGAFVKRGIV